MSKLANSLRRVSHQFCSAVIVAAGSSVRMGEDKLMMEIERIPVLARTLRAFEECGVIDEIIVVTRQEKLESVSQLCRNYRITKAAKVVIGGMTRTESALAGVCETDARAKLICIHDGARPLVTEDVIIHAVAAAMSNHAAAPAIPVKDTIRVKTANGYERPDRKNIFAVQTPQVFDADLIKGALTAAVQGGQDYSDDCAAAEALGIQVNLSEGDEENLKITTPTDILLAEAILLKRNEKK